jgi:hypothetical protein
MAEPKRKLTAAQKREKAKFMTIFINGKQKRVRRPILIDGLDPDAFYLRNADPIALHQDGLWEYMPEAKQDDIAFTDANDAQATGSGLPLRHKRDRR